MRSLPATSDSRTRLPPAPPWTDRIRVVAWTTGCMRRCRYCHNPDTWKLKNGIPVKVKQATDELRKYRHGLAIMSGGFTLSGLSTASP
jgi:pyruvate-formate lyase-activating enzyme